jgi:hypothetical protein
MHKFATLSCALLTLAGCAVIVSTNDANVSQSRSIGPFRGVDASNGLVVTLRCGDGPQVTLQGGSDDVEGTIIEVDHQILHIERRSLFGNHRRPVQIEVTAPQTLDNLTVSSGAVMTVPACSLSPDHLDLSGSSGGTMRLAGRTASLKAELSSGASISPSSGASLNADQVTASASSGGSLRLCSVQHLNGRASTGGSISADFDNRGDIQTILGGSVTARPCP